MPGENIVTISGNLTADPEIRFTQSGIPVAAFTVASSQRVYDQATGKWKDSEDTLFMRCSAWRDLADHVAESLRKGTRVMVSGRLKQRSYEPADRSGKVTLFEMDADDIGPSLKWATVEVRRAARDKAPHPADGPGPWQNASPPATENEAAAAASQPPF